MSARRLIAALAAIMFLTTPGFALSPGERLADPKLEQRAREISAELRCLVCQNQSIDDSDASLAKDLRRIVRERIAAGDSDAAVKDFLVARYGEFVLLRPTLSARNLLMWLLPFVALIGGFFAVRRMFAPAVLAPAPTAELSAEEQAALARLIEPPTGSEKITKNS
jgi:cytochrome c-type biogenesis protein CcmH